MGAASASPSSPADNPNPLPLDEVGNQLPQDKGAALGSDTGPTCQACFAASWCCSSRSRRSPLRAESGGGLRSRRHALSYRFSGISKVPPSRTQVPWSPTRLVCPSGEGVRVSGLVMRIESIRADRALHQLRLARLLPTLVREFEWIRSDGRAISAPVAAGRRTCHLRLLPPMDTSLFRGASRSARAAARAPILVAKRSPVRPTGPPLSLSATRVPL